MQQVEPLLASHCRRGPIPSLEAWVETLPALAMALVVGWIVLLFEHRLFVRINDKYVYAQNKAVGRVRTQRTHGRFRGRGMFTYVVCAYPGVWLILLVLVEG